MTLNHDLQRTAAMVLADLLKHTDLPEICWSLRKPGKFTHFYATPDLDIELLSGQADSHQAVRDWAEHLNTQVGLRRGITPEARVLVGGIVVRIWCAPEHRDDLPASEV